MEIDCGMQSLQLRIFSLKTIFLDKLGLCIGPWQTLAVLKQTQNAFIPATLDYFPKSLLKSIIRDSVKCLAYADKLTVGQLNLPHGKSNRIKINDKQLKTKAD